MISPPDWGALALFMGAVLSAALYGLSVSGHFPPEFRSEQLRRRWGALLLWATMAVTCLASAAALVAAWNILPWYATVIGGGAVLLGAPLLLQPLPDSFVNGRSALVGFSAGAALLAILMLVLPA
jgi:hypothetical protein